MNQPADSDHLVPREERIKVMLPARMRSASGWSDACILNVSSKGLLIYSGGAAQPGSFVEIRRGSQLVVAQVKWRKNQRIGLSSADRVRVLDIINDGTPAAVSAFPSARPVERRRIPRSDDQMRARGKAIEFLTAVLVSTALAGCAVIYVYEIMARPLTAVQSALAKG